jgi:hypothetical protein
MSTKISDLTASSTALKSTDLLEVSVFNGATYDSKKMNGSDILGERYIGEAYGGGVIFHLWRGSDGVQHGLIVGLTDLSTSQAWSNVTGTAIGVTAQSTWNGLANSTAIIAQSGHTNSAAKLCLDSTANGQTDWYLPAMDEFILLMDNRFSVNKTLSTIAGATQVALLSVLYWTSTEFLNTTAERFRCQSHSYDEAGKASLLFVRAIRQF